MKYTVKAGDNLWTLARQAGIPLQELLAQVPESVRRDPRKLQPGMVLNFGPESIMYGNRAPAAPVQARHAMSAPRPGAMTEQQRQQQTDRTLSGIGTALGLPLAAAGAGMVAPYVGAAAIDAYGIAEGGLRDSINAGGALASRGVDAGLEGLGRGIERIGARPYNAVKRGLGYLWDSRPGYEGRMRRGVEQGFDDIRTQKDARDMTADTMYDTPTSIRNREAAFGYREPPPTSIQPHPSRNVNADAESLNALAQQNPNLTLGELHNALRARNAAVPVYKPGGGKLPPLSPEERVAAERALAAEHWRGAPGFENALNLRGPGNKTWLETLE